MRLGKAALICCTAAIGVTLAAAAPLATNGGDASRTPSPDAAALLLKGKQVFGYSCAACHGQGEHEGRLLPGTFSLHVKYGADKPAALEERDDLNPDFVKYIVRNGQDGMPPFRKTEVSDADLEALAAYLASAPLATKHMQGAAQ